MQESDSPIQNQELMETKNTFWEFIQFFRDIIIILIVVIIIRSFIITPFRINGSSMESSYHDREYILVDKFSYLNFDQKYYNPAQTSSGIENSFFEMMRKIPINIGEPKRGDVVVITPHVDKDREFYVKRVIWLPWEVIRFESGSVFIKKIWSESFIKISEGYLDTKNMWQTYLPEYIEWNQFLIPEWSFWVMWDNRLNSSDSRSCFKNCFGQPSDTHFTKRRDIVGRVLIDFWYFNILEDDGLIKSGNLSWTHPPRFFSHPKSAIYPELD